MTEWLVILHYVSVIRLVDAIKFLIICAMATFIIAYHDEYVKTVFVLIKSQKRVNWANSWKFAFILSVLAHVLLISFFLILPAPAWTGAGKSASRGKKVSAAESSRRIVLKKELREEMPQSGREEEKKQESPAFVKTSDQQPKSEKTVKSPYVGTRNTKAEGGPKAPDDIREMPAQDGEENKGDDIVLFDQERQDGPLENEAGKGGAGVATPAVRKVVTREEPNLIAPESVPDPAFQPQEESADSVVAAEPMKGDAVGNVPQVGAEGTPSGQQHPVQTGKKSDKQDLSREDVERADSGKAGGKGDDDKGTHASGQVVKSDDSSVREENKHEELEQKDLNNLSRNVMKNDRIKPLPLIGESGASPSQTDLSSPAVAGGGRRTLPPPLSRASRRPVYDPVFSEMSQPGFKTAERRTKTSGRFVFGRNPSLDVAATPLGRYQAIVYRAIAMVWYDQCDKNRDLIVTGTLRIRILLNPAGKVVSMKLLGRSGASVAQNSFTFLSIKAAPIPPMPPEVKKELIGDRMELFFDFHF